MSRKSNQNVKNQLDEGNSSWTDSGVRSRGMIDICNLCKSPASSRCQRCGDSYCSLECQEEDWPRHRHICFPMPALVPMAKLLTKSAVSSAILHDQAKITPEKYQQVADSKSSMPPATSRKSSNGSNDIMPFDIKTLNLHSAEMSTVPPPQNNSYVLLTSFPFVHRAYVRSLTSEACKLFNDAIHEIDQAARNAPLFRVTDNVVGKHVMTKQGNHMCRGFISKVCAKNAVIVNLCDSGFGVFRKMNELSEMPAELLQIPRFAVQIQLSKVKLCLKSRKLREFMNKNLNKKFKLIYTDHAQTTNQVELFDCETNSSLNDEIIRFCAQIAAIQPPISSGDTIESNIGPTEKINENNTEKEKPYENGFDISNAATNATKKSASLETADNSKHGVDGITPNSVTNSKNVQKPNGRIVLTEQKSNDDRHIGNVADDSTASNKSCVKKTNFKYELFPEHATPVEATVVDTSTLALGYVGCIATSHIHHLKDIQKFLTAHMDDIPYKPSMDEIVVAKFEDEWYRAKVIGIEQSCTKYTVLYVDFTNLESVTCDEIRRYPSDLTIPCYTNLCLINGLPDKMSVAQVKFLEREIEVNSKIRFDMVEEILDLDQQTVLVQYNSLLKKMENAGLL